MSKLSAICVSVSLFGAMLLSLVPFPILGEKFRKIQLEEPSLPKVVHLQNQNSLDLSLQINGVPYFTRPEIMKSSVWQSPAYPILWSERNMVELTVGSGFGSVKLEIGDDEEDSQCNIVVSAGGVGTCSFVGRPAYEWAEIPNVIPSKIQSYCSETGSQLFGFIVVTNDKESRGVPITDRNDISNILPKQTRRKT